MKTAVIRKINWFGDACIGYACEDLKKDWKQAVGVDVISDYYCVVESGAVTVGTIESPAYVDLVRPYFDHMPSKWEEYAVCIQADRIVIVGVDKRAAMWGIYSISKRLGVLPASPFTETMPAKCEELKEEVYWDRPKNYQFRGWFLNSEVLLCKWHLGGGTRDFEHEWYHTLMDVSSLAVVVETALRMGINLIIPGSLIDIDDPRQEKLIAYCVSRGMYVSQHHVEPLGVSHYNYKAYYKKQCKEYAFSYVTEKERALECWKYYAAKWAKYKGDVVWQLGLRGRGDRPVWFHDHAQNTKQQWGSVISEAMQAQYDIVKELVGETFYSTTTLWMEGSGLHKAGYLDFPKNMTVVFSGIGPTQTMSDDFYDIERLPGTGYGIYYHANYMCEGPHLIMGADPRKMVDVYRQAMEHGDHTYSILNVGNIRELIPGIAANSEIVWDCDAFCLDTFYKRWCKEYYGNESLAGVFDDHFACFMPYPDEEVLNTYFGDGLRRKTAKGCLFNPLKDGAIAFSGQFVLRGEKDYTDWIPELEKSICRFQNNYARLCRKKAHSYFKQFAFQSRAMALLETWLLECIRYSADGEKHHLIAAAEAMQSYLDGRKAFEKGKFENWYRGDDQINAPFLLAMTEEKLNQQC